MTAKHGAPKVIMCSRDDAVEELAGLIRDRQHFVIPVHVDFTALSAITAISNDWTVFNDNGSNSIMQLSGHGDDRGLLDACITLTRGLAVQTMIIAKSGVVPDRLADFFDLEPDQLDNGADILIMSRPDDDNDTVHICYPMLFVDAIDRCDPIVAASLRAQGRPL